MAEVNTNAGLQDLLLQINTGFDELNAITEEQQRSSLESDEELRKAFAKIAEKRKKSTGEKLRPLVSAVQTIIDRQSGSRERRLSADQRQQSRQARSQAWNSQRNNQVEKTTVTSRVCRPCCYS